MQLSVVAQANIEAIPPDAEISVNDQMPADYAVMIKSIWQDESVKQVIKRGNEYALHDNLK